MLLYKRHEVLQQVRVGDDHGFPEQGSDLGSAYVEYIGKAGYVLERHVRAFSGKAVSESCSVDEERNPCLVAYGTQFFQFTKAVYCSVLCREGYVQHSRSHHMLICVVAVEFSDEVAYISRTDLALI